MPRSGTDEGVNVRPQPSLRRTFLFLQGPHGSFFPKLGAALEQVGHRVCRINLNGGDHATWPSGDNFGGPTLRWPRYLARTLDREAVTDLVLFGDSRPRHEQAIAIARRAEVRVHVFEEGYIRPDWVTLERNGVNGHSSLPRDPDWYVEQARCLPAVETRPPLPSYTAARGWAAFFYHAEVVLQFWRFPFDGGHRDRNPVWEGINFLRRFRRREAEAARTAEALATLGTADYFLFPLQLDSDYQIRIHSDFAAMRPAISTVLESFAAHAPAGMKLAIKEHPLDAGLRDWRAEVGEIAGALGIVDRIAFLEQGDLLALVLGSRGMVTVNSTSGTLALAAGKPVKALGKAVYDIAGVTDQQSLDTFWCAPQAPDPAIYEAFSRVLASRCLLHGAFLSNVGIEMMVSRAVERLAGHDDMDFVPSSPAVEYGRRR